MFVEFLFVVFQTPQKPQKQKQKTSADCLIFGIFSSNVFLWFVLHNLKVLCYLSEKDFSYRNQSI